MCSRLFGLILLLLVPGCSSLKPAIKNYSVDNFVISESVAEKVKGSGTITLLPHQLLPIDFMHRHPDQKGILINHYMGTGKTYLGIGLAQSYPDNPVIILAPRFLESHWKNQLQEYGVSNAKRFTFISYDDAPERIAPLDLSKHIILADEVHNLIKKMRSLSAEDNNRYTELYTKLKGAYKIIGLSGTPVYSDESDTAFLLNLVSGQELMPFNQESFRLAYTDVLPTRQFFRGFLTESNVMIFMLPPTLGLFSAALLGPWGMGLGISLGIGLTIGSNLFIDPMLFKLRSLNTQKMAPFFNQYISYFKFDRKDLENNFPEEKIETIKVPYNRYQYSLFLHLVEGDLPPASLQRLLQNERIKRSDEYIKINSTKLHEQIYSSIGAGRDIGNFEFLSSEGDLIEAPKFMRIYDELLKHNEATVLYSNYYETGILAFEKFLNRRGYKEKYAIIHPNMSAQDLNNMVLAYNNGDIRLLMLHPEITEGISLKGTQYLHILEPMINSTVLEQVIGRTRRFKSHTHLPKEKQVVNVRMWQSSSSIWNPEIGDLARVNWYKRYRELSYFSRWGIGISQVDKNYDKKALNPEELSLLKLQTLEQNLNSMQKILTASSIETRYTKN